LNKSDSRDEKIGGELPRGFGLRQPKTLSRDATDEAFSVAKGFLKTL
jgi:hypothetical protein